MAGKKAQVEADAEPVADPAGIDEFDAAVAEFSAKADEAQSGKDPALVADANENDDGTDEDSAQAGASVTDGPDGDDTSHADNKSTDNDPWANAPSELRELHERAQRDAELRLRSEQGRIRTLQQQLNQRQQQQDGQPNNGTGGGTEEGGKPKTSRLAEILDDYPDLAGPINEEFSELRAELAELKKGYGAIEQERVGAVLNQQQQLLGTKHPDWMDAVSDDRFGGWLDSQPTSVREAFARNEEQIVDGEDAAFVVGLFKTSVGFGQPAPRAEAETNDKRRKQLAGGRDGGRSGNPVKAGVPDDMEAAANFYADQIDR